MEWRKYTFLDTLFSAPFISDSFQKLILIRVNNTQDSHSQQLIWIDLLNGTETTISEPGFYGKFGHFQSFDGLFFQNGNTVNVFDFERNISYHLDIILEKHFKHLKVWDVCPVRDCIIVYTEEPEDNLKLFNVNSEWVVATCSLPYDPKYQTQYSFLPSLISDEMIVSVSHSQKNDQNVLQFVENQFYSLSFLNS